MCELGSYSAGIDFRRQNLTLKELQYWPITTDNMGIQMNRKELTKTFIMISNWKNSLLSIVLEKTFQLI